MSAAAAKRNKSAIAMAAASGDVPLPPFEGFPVAGLSFLRGLDANNEKAWFEAHRDEYEDGLRAPFAALIAGVANALAVSGLRLQSDPRRAMFRLNRDVRFSADKRPYKPMRAPR